MTDLGPVAVSENEGRKLALAHEIRALGEQDHFSRFLARTDALLADINRVAKHKYANE